MRSRGTSSSVTRTGKAGLTEQPLEVVKKSTLAKSGIPDLSPRQNCLVESPAAVRRGLCLGRLQGLGNS